MAEIEVENLPSTSSDAVGQDAVTATELSTLYKSRVTDILHIPRELLDGKKVSVDLVVTIRTTIETATP